MSFQQFPTPLYALVIPFDGTVSPLAGFRLNADMDLKYIVSTIFMSGLATTERVRLKLYGQAAQESSLATSEWRSLTDFSDDAGFQIGTLRFDFDDAVPINAENTYYVGIETENIVPGVALDCILDWNNDVYTAASALERGAQMRFIGYREVEMGQVKRLSIAEGATITAPTALSFTAGVVAMVGEWTSPDGSGAPTIQEFGSSVYQFPDGADVEIHMMLKVPESYQAATQINVMIGLYSQTTTSLTMKMKATSYLLRDNNDAVSSTTNSHSSVNAALTNTIANRLRKTSVDLTSVSGQINAVSVTAGDRIHIVLTRDYANDTDTSYVRVFPLSEVLFG